MKRYSIFFNYGKMALFTLLIVTNSCEKNEEPEKPKIVTVPSITTTEVSSVEGTTAISGATINNDGGSSVTSRGICWNIAPNPGITLTTKTSDGNGTGSFISLLTGLSPNTKYYIRGYATNSAGTSYGNEVSFVSSILRPEISATITELTSTTAIFSINISSDGGLPVLMKGICWGRTNSPTIDLISRTYKGPNSGVFTDTISKLTSGNNYFMRAYAITNKDTAYSNEIGFTTSNHLIGESYQGGKIYYILQPIDEGYIAGETHGLIAAPSDQTDSVEWGCTGISITGADETKIGSGKQNTIDILASCFTLGIAARVCDTLILNGYSDWYLPSIEEFKKLYQAGEIVGELKLIPFYWTSSEVGYNNYFAQSFYIISGSASLENKDKMGRVRAIRSF